MSDKRHSREAATAISSAVPLRTLESGRLLPGDVRCGGVRTEDGAGESEILRSGHGRIVPDARIVDVRVKPHRTARGKQAGAAGRNSSTESSTTS
jgi:hypothetical protein